jgi:hypothetical protein
VQRREDSDDVCLEQLLRLVADDLQREREGGRN